MFFLCRRFDLTSRDTWNVSLDKHLEWMKVQHEEGRVLLSGPAPGKKCSFYLIKTNSEAEAQSIAREDPYTAAGLCDFELYPWNINQILGVGSFVAQR